MEEEGNHIVIIASNGEENSSSSSIIGKGEKPKSGSSSSRRASVTYNSKPLCDYCKKPILKERLEAMDKTFHPEHFKCKRCRKPLTDYFVINGKAYCRKCHTEKTCDKCEQCKQPITQDKIVALGKFWHADHFFCHVCKSLFTSETPFCEKDGKAYCEKDFNEAFMPKCAKCGKAIVDGTCVSALGKKWHPEHFTCTICNVAIDVGAPVYVHNGKPYCPKDYPEGEGEDMEDDDVVTATSKNSSRMRVKRSRSFNKSEKQRVSSKDRDRSSSTPNLANSKMHKRSVSAGSPSHRRVMRDKDGHESTDDSDREDKDRDDGFRDRDKHRDEDREREKRRAKDNDKDRDGERDKNRDKDSEKKGARRLSLKLEKSWKKVKKEKEKEKEREREKERDKDNSEQESSEDENSERSKEYDKDERNNTDSREESPIRENEKTQSEKLQAGPHSYLQKVESNSSIDSNEEKDKDIEREGSLSPKAVASASSGSASCAAAAAAATGPSASPSISKKGDTNMTILTKKVSREFSSAFAARLPKALSGRKLKDRLTAKGATPKLISDGSNNQAGEMSEDELADHLEEEDGLWENTKALAKRTWPKRVLPTGAEAETFDLISDIPGYNRELGGEQDPSGDNGHWSQHTPHSMLYYKRFMHDADIELEHYVVCDDPNRPIIITAEAKGRKRRNSKKKEYVFRAIIRTVAGEERYVLSCPVDTKKARIQALKQVNAQLQDAKLIEVKDKKYGDARSKLDEVDYEGHSSEGNGEDGKKALTWVGRTLSEDLVIYEIRMFTNTYKIGVLYAKENQVNESDMYANEVGSPAFEEFLSFLGEKIVLKGWDRFRAGLNVTGDLTGTHSIYSEFNGFEVMFHVSTYIPYTTCDAQQVERKRHLGNDVVLVIFRDAGNTSISPEQINSQFNHVFCVVQPEGNRYRVAFSCKQGVYPNPPYLPCPALFEKNQELHDFLLTKLINAEIKAMNAQQFSVALRRTRRQLLQELVQKHT